MSVIPPEQIESFWDDENIKEQMREYIENADICEDMIKARLSAGSFQKEYEPPHGTATESKMTYDTFKTDIIQDLLEIADDIKKDEAMIKLRSTITEDKQPVEEVEEESDSDLFFDPKDLDI